MKYKKHYPFLALVFYALLLVSYQSPAQSGPTPEQYNLNGTVKDSYGPMPGVHILIKGTNTGTFTDKDGEFSLMVGPTNTLVFSYLGYRALEVSILGRTTLEVELLPEATQLQEVEVNAGYYTVKERERTGSISRVTAEEIGMQPVSNPLAAMQGRMTGVNITQTSGVPGAGFNIQIRGRNSIAAGNNPLYVIDGVPVSSEKLDSYSSIFPFEVSIDPLNNINPNNIQSIEILKDADATAIYGSRGANGVVLITTKKGKAGKTRVDINVRSGIGEVSNKMKLLNTPQYLEMRYEALANDGAEPSKNIDPDLLLWDQNRYTDWQDKLFGGAASITDTQGFVSGGNQQTSFRFGGGVRKENTVFPGDFGYRKIMGSLNLSHISENKRFRAEISVTYGKDINNLFSNNLVENALKLAPNAPALYDSKGDLNWEVNDEGVSTFNNPLAPMLNTQRVLSSNLIVNTVLSYELLKDLQLKVSAGYTDFKQHETVLTTKDSYKPELRAYRDFRHQRLTQEGNSWILEPQLNYSKSIKNSKFDFLIGATWQRRLNAVTGIDAYGYSSEVLLNNINAALESDVIRDYNNEYKYNALYGRLGYNFKKRYFINLTGRRDGSSRFGPGKQFANFGAVGAAWIFSEESFINDQLPFLSFGKIRGSYGTTGNDGIPDYGFLSTYRAITQPSNFRGNGGLYPTRLANSDYSWETNKKLEGALDLGFINDHIQFSVNWYCNRSSNQLVGYRLPYITGFNSVQANLPATVQNTGWELRLTTSNIVSPSITWTTNVNWTIPKNKLVDYLNIEATPYGSTYEIGESLNIRKLYKFQGVDPETGLYEVADINKDGRYTQDDRVALITMDRNYYGGFQNALSYKGLRLDLLLEFVKQNGNGLIGNLVPGFSPYYAVGGNQHIEVMNRWRKSGDITNVQKYSQIASNYTPYTLARESTLNIVDASFIRLKNISLSYNFNGRLLEKLNLNQLGISIQAQNLWTWTSYFGLDPQSPGSLTTLPALRMVTASVHLQF